MDSAWPELKDDLLKTNQKVSLYNSNWLLFSSSLYNSNASKLQENLGYITTSLVMKFNFE